MQYPYKYKHQDEAGLTAFGRHVSGTEIYAKKQICVEMLRAYRQKKGLNPLYPLHEKGIWFHEKFGKCAIIITCPKDYPTKEEAESFPHRQIASEITKLWRGEYGDNKASE